MIQSSERDNSSPLTLPADLCAADIMNSELLMINEDWPVTYLAEFLTENSISGGPVISEDGKLVGVVSLTDIVRHDSLPNREPHRDIAHEYYRHALEQDYSEQDLTSFRFGADSETTVGDIMTPMIFSVPEDVPVQVVASTMVTGRIHRVLVTRNGDLVGIISALDVLKLVANGD